MIPLSSPKASYLAHRSEIDFALQEVLQSGNYILDSTVAAFEQEFAQFLGTRAVAGVANGTDAIALALRALDIRPGERVLSVSHTAVATIAAIEMAGGIPVLIDVDRESFSMRADLLADTIANLRKKNLPIKAVVLVHLYGQCGQLDEILKICNEFEIALIEDCAQANGANYNQQTLGSFGRLAAFSFYPTKNLGALGDGGAIASNDNNLISKIKALRQYGWDADRSSQIPGVNSRLDPLQAAILRVKLKYLDSDNQKRRNLAEIYKQELHGCLEVPSLSLNSKHVYHLYVVKSQQRSELQSFLAKKEIGSGIHYPLPVHLQTAYKNRVETGAAGLATSEMLCSQILSLPMFPELEAEQALQVCKAVREWHATLS